MVQLFSLMRYGISDRILLIKVVINKHCNIATICGESISANDKAHQVKSGIQFYSISDLSLWLGNHGRNGYDKSNGNDKLLHGRNSHLTCAILAKIVSQLLADIDN